MRGWRWRPTKSATPPAKRRRVAKRRSWFLVLGSSFLQPGFACAFGADSPNAHAKTKWLRRPVAVSCPGRGITDDASTFNTRPPIDSTSQRACARGRSRSGRLRHTPSRFPQDCSVEPARNSVIYTATGRRSHYQADKLRQVRPQGSKTRQSFVAEPIHPPKVRRLATFATKPVIQECDGAKDRVEVTGLRPSPLPHHRTCRFQHPAVEPWLGHGLLRLHQI